LSERDLNYKIFRSLINDWVDLSLKRSKLKKNKSDSDLDGWLGRKADPVSTLTLMRGWQMLMTIISMLIDTPSFIRDVHEFLGKKNV
jgi:hypothetical protein